MSKADQVVDALRQNPELLAEVKAKLNAESAGPVEVILAVCQDWTESESGWGRRPDGHTLHLTREDRDLYVEGHGRDINNKAQTPAEYTTTDGKPRTVVITEAQAVAITEQLAKDNADVQFPWRRHGIWGHRRHYGPKAYEP